MWFPVNSSMTRSVIATLQNTTVSAALYPHEEPAPFAMCFTEKALRVLERTVFTRRPETGAKGFALVDHFGFEVVEFDYPGSSESSGSVYRPDVKWGSGRCEFHIHELEQRRRLWVGDVHSHPGESGRPSLRAGAGLGDLGYVESVFEMNEAMQFYALPIVTGAGTDNVTIHPWVCVRDRPLRVLCAEVRICNVEEFPTRIFNPEWERLVAAQPSTGRKAEKIDADVVQRHLRRRTVRSVVSDGEEFFVVCGSQAIQVRIPDGFPIEAPELVLMNPGYFGMIKPIPWAKYSLVQGEERLANLCDWVFDGYGNQF